MKYDVIIVGAGPAGIFTALELVRNNSERKILIIEKGPSAEKRYCHVTTDFSGAGAFSEGKLSPSCGDGGTLSELIGEKKVEELIDYTDKIYLEFGADERVDRPMRCLEPEMAQRLYSRIEKHLLDNGVEILFGTACDDIIVENGECAGVICSGSPIYSTWVVLATGKEGADWLKKICMSHSCSCEILKKDNAGRVEMDEYLKTNLNHLHCLGDSSGWMRGFMMALVMGVFMGWKIYYYEFAQKVFIGR